MNFFRNTKVRTPAELVRFSNDQLSILSKGDARSEKASEGVAKALEAMKLLIFGDSEHEPNPDQITLLVTEIYKGPFISSLVQNLPYISFEARKDSAHIFKTLMQRQEEEDNKRPGVSYVLERKELLPLLVRGYESDVALVSGSMLRECLKHEILARMLLWSDHFFSFFEFVELPTFDVASDAFVTFRDLLTRHKTMCAEFLDKNYDRVFEEYTQLLISENYVTRRQSLKLLGELLLDRKNFAIMTRYIASTDNLKLMMNMLRDKSKSIQFEAFHVFKVFVANPHKPDPIKQILMKNREKLVKYLSDFHNDKADDDQFKEEKAFLIREVSTLSL